MPPSWILSPATFWTAWVLAALVLAAGIPLLWTALNEKAGLEPLLGPPGGRFWATLSLALVSFFLLRALWPLLPGDVLGVKVWPIRITPGTAIRHCLPKSAGGAPSFWIARARGRS